jgi:hypothetical protein
MQIGIGLGLTSRRLGFSPASLFALSEPGVWLDPSDLTTMFQDTAGATPVTTPGQTVARINDKSGRGNHATQATAASRPTYQVDGNGRGYLAFDGVDDFLVTPTITPGIDKVQVFAGVRKLVNANNAGCLVELSTSAGSNGSFNIRAPISSLGEYIFSSRGNINVAATSGVFTAPITNVLSGIGDISGDTATLRVNGTQSAQSTADQGTNNYLAYPLYIGRRAGTSLPFNGHLYGLLVRFGANLTTDQITSTETWVNGKTGAF